MTATFDYIFKVNTTFKLRNLNIFGVFFVKFILSFVETLEKCMDYHVCMMLSS